MCLDSEKLCHCPYTEGGVPPLHCYCFVVLAPTCPNTPRPFLSCDLVRPYLRQSYVIFRPSLYLLALRSLFHCIPWTDGREEKRPLPSAKRTVLSMRHGYLATELSREVMLLCGLTKWQRSNCKQMRKRQWAQVTVSKQYREHSFCRHRPRLQTAVASKSVSSQGRGLFSLRLSVQWIQWKRGLC